MSGHAFGLIEVIGVFAVLLGVLGWQWLSIRRTLKDDRERERHEDTVIR